MIHTYTRIYSLGELNLAFLIWFKWIYSGQWQGGEDIWALSSRKTLPPSPKPMTEGFFSLPWTLRLHIPQTLHQSPKTSLFPKAAVLGSRLNSGKTLMWIAQWFVHLMIHCLKIKAVFKFSANKAVAHTLSRTAFFLICVPRMFQVRMWPKTSDKWK